jgi:hypothetical protein
MPLFCTVCKNDVPPGFSQCLICKAGFAPQLACVSCRVVVPRGVASCATCERKAVVTTSLPPLEALPVSQAPVSLQTLPVRLREVGIVAPSMAPPALPGLPAHVGMMAVPEVYQHGRFGVDATVYRNPQDVEILTKMGQTVVILHTLAADMNKFCGHMETTRRVIRSCRDLASELQDEIETRRGPQG